MGDLTTPTMERHEELKLFLKNIVYLKPTDNKQLNSFIQELIRIFEKYG